MSGHDRKGEIGRAVNANDCDENHTRSYFRSRRACSDTIAFILIPFPNPFRDSFCSSQILVIGKNSKGFPHVTDGSYDSMYSPMQEEYKLLNDEYVLPEFLVQYRFKGRAMGGDGAESSALGMGGGDEDGQGVRRLTYTEFYHTSSL